MIKIGAILFAIGILILSPLDDIIILIPLSLVVGLWIFPLFVCIGIICLIIGAILLGKHILPLFSNPVLILFLIVAILITVYCCIVAGWIYI